MDKLSDKEIEKIILEAVEYYKQHPSRINTFINTDHCTGDIIDKYIIKSIKDILMKGIEDGEINETR